MGMYGEWLRVTPDELERAKADLDWAEELAEQIAETEYGRDDGSDLPDRRNFGTDKTWHALDYLLTRKGFPISIVFGEESFVDDEDEADVDWGYGPPRYLTAEQVRAAAEALASVTEEALLDGVDAADLVAEEIYPNVWDRPGELPWAVGELPNVKTYFAAAAKAGDAIICWIS
jgi:hypothetical protein